jgi:hypothetical protein
MGSLNTYGRLHQQARKHPVNRLMNQLNAYTGLFEMIVVVLTTQYTSDRSMYFFI